MPELLAALAVLGVILTVGMPAMASIREQARISAAFSLLTSSLASARILAISRNQPITVCPSQDGRQCRADLTWDQGWIIYLDPARQAQPADIRDVLQHTAAPAGITIRSTPGRHRVRYLSDGQSSGSNVTLSLCSAATSRLSGRILVNNAGRARSERAINPAVCPHAP